MNDMNNYIEMIPEYLLGKLNTADREAFEKQLAENPQLQQELRTMTSLRDGLNLYEKATKGHIPSDILATFASNPELVDKNDLDLINKHLPNCPSCRDELTLCTPMKPAKEQPDSQTETGDESLFSRILAPMWRPVFTALLVLFVAIPAIYIGLQSPPPREATATFEIAPVSRDIHSLNKIDIHDNIGTVSLNFLLAVPDSDNLDCILVDEHGEVIHEWQYDGSHNPIALELAVSYFDTGIYSLKVRTTGSEDETDWFVFRLQVSLD